MKKISLQWKLTLLTTVLITILCGCLTFFLYKKQVRERNFFPIMS